MSESGDSRRPGVYLNTGTSKVLARVMSDVFEVYSAGKFPGMLEPSALTKKFATQGVWLTVRHSDGSSSNRVKTEEDDDNSGDESTSIKSMCGIWGARGTGRENGE